MMNKKQRQSSKDFESEHPEHHAGPLAQGFGNGSGVLVIQNNTNYYITGEQALSQSSMVQSSSFKPQKTKARQQILREVQQKPDLVMPDSQD